MKNSVYVAQMESESFSWLSVGETEEQAKTAILKEWNKRIKSNSEYYGILFEKWDMEKLETYYAITVEKIGNGQCRVL